MPAEDRRYAIAFTPPAYDLLTIAGANWLGRNAYSGTLIEAQKIGGLGLHEMAYHTALPRRQGFQAPLKAPFHLAQGLTEADLLKALMHFATLCDPFQIAPLRIAAHRGMLVLEPQVMSMAMVSLATSIMHDFDCFRAPLSEADLERRNTDSLTPQQFANLCRWGEVDVLDSFRFHIPLTGELDLADRPRFEQAAAGFFGAALFAPVQVANIALFIEEEPGAPFLVHSLHPLGALPARRSA